MKTLFTFLFTVSSLTSVVAQRNSDYHNNRDGRDENSTVYNSKNNNDRYGKNDDQRDYAYNDRHHNASFSKDRRARDFQIQRINEEYDYKIHSVIASRYMRPREKKFEIRNLENQRRDKIMRIQTR